MVTIYSATWCSFCHATMQYMDKLGVKYEVRDVEEKRENAEEAVQKSGQMGIPVVDVEGDVIVGFDRPKLDAAFKAHNVL